MYTGPVHIHTPPMPHTCMHIHTEEHTHTNTHTKMHTCSTRLSLQTVSDQFLFHLKLKHRT